MRVYLNTDVIILMMYHQEINVAKLADRAGYAREYLGKVIRSGESTDDMADKIAGALGLPYEAVLLPVRPTDSLRKSKRVDLNYEAVRRIMRAQKVSVKDVAQKMGMSYQAVYYILQRRTPQRSGVEKLAAALGVEPEAIIKEAVQDE